MIGYKRKYVIRSGLIVGGFVALLSGAPADQGSDNPFLVALVVSVPAYFFLLKWLYPVMRDEGARPNPSPASNSERWSIWGAILIVLTIFMKVLVAISFSEPKVHFGVVVEKNMHYSKFRNGNGNNMTLWMTVSDGYDSFYLNCMYYRCAHADIGRGGRIVYRDSLFGVRRIVEYEPNELGPTDSQKQ